MLTNVWYHSNCSTRGRGCYNTRLLDQGGCCTWYNEPNLLSEIEEHLGVTIDTVDKHLSVPVDAFDGKVVYGQKLKQMTTLMDVRCPSVSLLPRDCSSSDARFILI
ncbi:unnamed protein product [Trichobilharzia regenti]|nr:unnamed protein product [Trichobilharzia regenti]